MNSYVSVQVVRDGTIDVVTLPLSEGDDVQALAASAAEQLHQVRTGQ